MSDDLTRLRNENMTLRRVIGEQTAMLARAHEMLPIAQQAQSRSIDQMANEAIRKAAAK